MEKTGTAELGVAAWLKDCCGMPAEKAVSIAQRLESEFWVSKMSALQQMASNLPEILDSLQCPKSMQLIIANKLKAYNKKSLEKLTTREVEHMVNELFPEEHYGTSLRSNKINGTVLGLADGAQRLGEWGVSSTIHSEALWHNVCAWRTTGVPLQLLEGVDVNASFEGASQSSKQLIATAPVLKRVGDAPAPGAKRAKYNNSTNGTGSFSVSEDEIAAAEAGGASAHDDSGSEKKGSCSGRKRTNRELTSLTQEILAPPRPRSVVEQKPIPGIRAAKPAPPAAPAQRAPVKVHARTPVAKADKTSERSGSSVESPSLQGEGAGTLNARMKQLYQMLCSKDKDTVSAALKSLSKQAADHPETVGCIRQVGALDKMMEMLRGHAKLDEYVLWRVLVALNNTIARAKHAHVKYLVDSGLMELVVPLCDHPASCRVRLQALWIVGNMGTGEGEGGFKNVIVSRELVETIVESYETVYSLSYSGPDNIAQRYAETAKQLSCERTKQQFQFLQRLIPMVRDIIQRETNVEAVMDACFALQHLLDADDAATADALIDADVLPALVSRLDDPKVQVALHALETLKVFAECSTSEQVLEMEVALPHLEKFIVGSPGVRPNKKLTVQATLALIPVCEGGDQSVQQVLDQAPDLFPSLLDHVRAASSAQSLVREIAENCALALMCAVQSASLNQLDYFLSLGVYPITFRLLDAFSDDLDIVLETLRAISNVLSKQDDPVKMQAREAKNAEFDVAAAWKTVENVRRLLGGSVLDEAVEEDKVFAITTRADKLLATAAKLGLRTSVGDP